MSESKLRTLSIDFAVQILNLVKILKSQHETIVSNQIGRAGTPVLEQISTKHNMPMENWILSPNCKSPQRSQRNKLLAGTSLENKLY